MFEAVSETRSVARLETPASVHRLSFRVRSRASPAAALTGAQFERAAAPDWRGALADFERSSATVDAVHDALIGVDRELFVVYFNAAAERLLGWSAAFVVGRHVDVLTPAAYARVLRKHGHRIDAHVIEQVAGVRERFPVVTRDASLVAIDIMSVAAAPRGSRVRLPQGPRARRR